MSRTEPKIKEPGGSWWLIYAPEVRAFGLSWSDVKARAKDKRAWRKLVVDLCSRSEGTWILLV
jgi:hypothetical protein